MSFRQDSEGDISIPYTSPPADYQEKDEHGIEEEDEDEEYGKPVVARIGNVSSGSSSSSDDLVSPAQQEAPDSDRSFECPFSINNPVPDEADASVIEASSPQSNFLGIDGIDSRMRGDSLSSMSTNPSAYVVTPALSHMNLPPSIYSSPIIGAELPEGVEPEDSEEVVMLSFKRSVAHVHNDDEYVDIPQPSPGMSSPRSSTTTRSSRTSRPVDIDIRSISSHAQAEALVQQAEQRILEFVNSPSAEDVTEISPHPSTISVSTAGEGRTPLSARLAAYGQSLKIEQKFKEVEEKRNSPQSLTLLSSRPGSVVMDEGREWSMAASSGARGLDRTFSLEERHHTPGSRNGRVRRPHTAGGTPMSDTPGITVSREQSPLRSSHSHSHHQHSLSSAAALSTFESSAKSSIRLGGSGISISTPVGTTSITPPSSFLSPGLPMTKSISSSRSDPHSHSPLASGTLTPLTPLDRPRIIQRSRTPDPTEDRDYAVSPRPIGVPLSRYSTAPHDLNDLATGDTSDFLWLTIARIYTPRWVASTARLQHVSNCEAGPRHAVVDADPTTIDWYQLTLFEPEHVAQWIVCLHRQWLVYARAGLSNVLIDILSEPDMFSCDRPAFKFDRYVLKLLITLYVCLLLSKDEDGDVSEQCRNYFVSVPAEH
ncbi:hypothetical protein EUX98_g6487 [Antrodiella citrinella]|uniref:Uncharacterized protein n=1 Tax=Antrodiella citrinella TaxID=2447956 RepID=A0A4S4MWD9_9APHY|nr:hypothetical protein EUX98_g6487 [Antrodiella citrinella]